MPLLSIITLSPLPSSGRSQATPSVFFSLARFSLCKIGAVVTDFTVSPLLRQRHRTEDTQRLGTAAGTSKCSRSVGFGCHGPHCPNLRPNKAFHLCCTPGPRPAAEPASGLGLTPPLLTFHLVCIVPCLQKTHASLQFAPLHTLALLCKAFSKHLSHVFFFRK